MTVLANAYEQGPVLHAEDGPRFCDRPYAIDANMAEHDR